MLRKKTKRDTSKYPALDPKLNLKTRIDILDFDYVDKLPETWTDPKTGKTCNPKQYLNDFANEYVNAAFDNKKRVQRKKKVESEKNQYLRELKEKILAIITALNELITDSNINVKSKNNLKKVVSKFKKGLKKVFKEELAYIDDYYKKEAENRNNARNRCIFTRSKAQGKLLNTGTGPEKYQASYNIEDELIDAIDKKSELAKKLQDDTDDSGYGPEDA